MTKFLNITLLFALFFLVSCNNKTQNSQEAETPTVEASPNPAIQTAQNKTETIAKQTAITDDSPKTLEIPTKENASAKKAPASSMLKGKYAESAKKKEAQETGQSRISPTKTKTTKRQSETVQKPKPIIQKPAAEVVEEPIEEIAEPLKSAVPTHEIWNGLLSRYVNSVGKVNYDGLKSNESTLDEYLALLSANAPQSDWTSNEAKAFWLNAYNAYTVKLILKNYPVASITDLHGGKPWDVKWIKIGEKTYSLNNIENDIVRPTYKDGRIHFAVNCAAKSCPPLYNKAFKAEGLSGTLTALAKKFINNSQYNTVGTDAVKISKIFEWYAVDFGDLVTYLNKYSTTKINAGATVSYQDYDWKLNK